VDKSYVFMFDMMLAYNATYLNNRCVRTKSERLNKSKVLNASDAEFDFPSMQTMDRRVSSSSDQIDTLRKHKIRAKPVRTQSSSRLSFEQKVNVNDDSEDAGFVTAKIHHKCDLSSSSFHRNIPRTGGDMTKTPFALFLENDGPYSRKLFGPLDHRESYIEREERDRRKKTLPIISV
jgi:hypothetical protein